MYNQEIPEEPFLDLKKFLGMGFCAQYFTVSLNYIEIFIVLYLYMHYTSNVFVFAL